jgi:hypothetical protein
MGRGFGNLGQQIAEQEIYADTDKDNGEVISVKIAVKPQRHNS